MIRKIIYLLFALLTISQSTAQEKSFEEKAKILSTKIEKITNTEKKLLKKDITAIDKLYNNNEITYDEAEKKKKEAATLHANNIKKNIDLVENQLTNLIQKKVDSIIETDTDSESVYINIDFNGISIKTKKRDKENTSSYKDKRTYSYLVLAGGLNNLIDGNLNSIQDYDFEFGKSHFFELGWNNKTRMLKNANLLYINYGLSFRYNELHPKSNQFFVTDGNHTFLEEHPKDLLRSSFKNVQLVVPVFFEFDFGKAKTKKDRIVYKPNRSFRFGFGGFAGFNIKTKQVLKYRENGRKTKQKEKGNFNVNNFVYGLQGEIGYRSFSLYTKYDLNDVFKDSFQNQKNISFGIRFDL